MSDINAKLAYLLSICHKFSESFFATMTKQYEKDRILATRHYFTLMIDLYEPPNTNKFSVKNVYCSFANSKNVVLLEALQYHNNKILSWEMKHIYEALKNQNINLDVHQIISLYTVASLIKIYRASKDQRFKYIFVPVIINYGRSSTLYHQTALIVDYENSRCMYYEPYGKYTKYGKTYSESICNLFRVFDNLDLFDSQLQSETYHKTLGLSQGIQEIILQKNNKRYNQFNDEFNTLVQTIKKEFPDQKIEPVYKIAELDKQDYTFKILDLLFNFDISKIDELHPEKIHIYKELLYKTLEIFCCYNSKTCVTITLIEMDYFFKLTGDDMSKKIKSLYDEFDVDKPNIILMTKLNSLINVFKNSKDIKNTVRENMHVLNICRNLYE